MARRALLRLLAFDLPPRWQGKAPAVGTSSLGAEEVDENERARIGVEAARGKVLINKAKRHQQHLLERLARAAGPRGVRFFLLSTLEKFLAATKSLDAKAAATLSHDELAELWRTAEAGEEELRNAPPEPELRMCLSKPSSLIIEVVGRRGRAAKVPDRIAQEAHVGGVLISKASPAQVALLERVARAGGDAGAQFPFVSMLAQFLAATRTFNPRAAAKLSDQAVATLWRQATALD
jgi:hypothetical protein